MCYIQYIYIFNGSVGSILQLHSLRVPRTEYNSYVRKGIFYVFIKSSFFFFFFIRNIMQYSLKKLTILQSWTVTVY